MEESTEMQSRRIYYSLYSRLLSESSLLAAFSKVKKADGSAGIDSQSRADFASNKDGEIRLFLSELKTKS